jgi:hypothetical protein
MAAALGNKEKRLDKRYETNTSMTWFRFSSDKTPHHAATACNCSQGGLCFQSPRPLKPGQTLCIYIEAARNRCFPIDSGQLMLKSFSLVEVRWCRKQDSAGAADYNVGVQYL